MQHDLRAAVAVAVRFWDALAAGDSVALGDLLASIWDPPVDSEFARNYLDMQRLTPAMCRLLGHSTNVEELGDDRVRLWFVPGVTQPFMVEGGTEIVAWRLELVWERDAWRVAGSSELPVLARHEVRPEEPPPGSHIH